jgi:hypothetical protein
MSSSSAKHPGIADGAASKDMDMIAASQEQDVKPKMNIIVSFESEGESLRFFGVLVGSICCFLLSALLSSFSSPHLLSRPRSLLRVC